MMFTWIELGVFWTWMAAVMIIALLLYIVGTWNYDTFQKRDMRYLAPKFPFVGNIGALFSGKLSYPELVLDLYKRSKGWPYCGLFEFTRPFIILRDPELIKTIAVKHFDNFTTHRTLAFEDLDPMLAKSILSLGGDKWRKMKQNMSPAFTSSKIKTQFYLMRECAQLTCNYMEKLVLQHQSSYPLEVDLKELYMKYSLNVIVSIAYGTSVNAYEDKNNAFWWAGRQFMEMIVDVLTVGGYLMWPKLMHMLRIPVIKKDVEQFLHQATQDAITQRAEQNTVRPDIIQLLLSLKEQQKQNKFDDMDISGIATSFFIAGFESISTFLYFVCYLLAVNPDKQQLIQEEVDRLTHNGNCDVTYEIISKMQYLEMVLLEAVRLYPPLLTVDRVCEKTCLIPVSPDEPPLTIKVGELVTIPIYALHLDPEYFPDPEKFEPERFNEENIKNIKPYTYIPFGTGPRKCMGQRFAMLESKMLLVTLLSRFSFAALNSTPIPMAMKKRKLLLTPEGGFTLGLIPRRK